MPSNEESLPNENTPNGDQPDQRRNLQEEEQLEENLEEEEEPEESRMLSSWTLKYRMQAEEKVLKAPVEFANYVGTT